MARHKKVCEGSALVANRYVISGLSLGAVLGVGVIGATPASAVSIPKPVLRILGEGGKELGKNLCKDHCGDIAGKILPGEAPANEWANDAYKSWEKKAYAEFDEQAAAVSADAPDRQKQLQKIADSVYNKYRGYWGRLDAVSLFEYTTPYTGEDGKIPEGAYLYGGQQFGPSDRERLGYGFEDSVQNRRDSKEALKSVQNGLLKRAGLPVVDNAGFWTPAERLQDANSGRTYWEWVPTKERGGGGSIGLQGTPLTVDIGGNSGYKVSRFIYSPKDAQEFLDQYRLGRSLANQPGTSGGRNTVEERAGKYENILKQLASNSAGTFKDPDPGPQSRVSVTPANLSGVRQGNGTEAMGGQSQEQGDSSGSQVRKPRAAGYGSDEHPEVQQPAPTGNLMQPPSEEAGQGAAPASGDSHAGSRASGAGGGAGDAHASGTAMTPGALDNDTETAPTAPAQDQTDHTQDSAPPVGASNQQSGNGSSQGISAHDGTPTPAGPPVAPLTSGAPSGSAPLSNEQQDQPSTHPRADVPAPAPAPAASPQGAWTGTPSWQTLQDPSHAPGAETPSPAPAQPVPTGEQAAPESEASQGPGKADTWDSQQQLTSPGHDGQQQPLGSLSQPQTGMNPGSEAPSASGTPAAPSPAPSVPAATSSSVGAESGSAWAAGPTN
jgi:hypothetical protein